VIRVLTSSSAAARLAAVRAVLATRPPSEEIAIVAASRGAADDFVRTIARERGATFGLTRFSLTELAARAAALHLGAARTPATKASADAMAARAVFDSRSAGELHYFAPVAATPGFPRAVARTIHELRLAGIDRRRVAATGPAGTDLDRLLERVEAQLALAAVDDRAALFLTAAEACRAKLVRWVHCPTVLLDVPLDSRVEREFVAALTEVSPLALATIADGDEFAAAAYASIGGIVNTIPDDAGSTTDLAHLRRYVFTPERPSPRGRAGDVALFSAPGEGREAVEIIRRVLDEASRGVPFDQMAVLLRAPQQYLGLLEQASARGEVPLYLDRGTRRPDPSGRAFLALLSCAAEGLSARRFDEYLSLGQVPAMSDGPARSLTVQPRDEAVAGVLAFDDAAPDGDDPPDEPPPPDSEDDAIVAGTLRAPWKWEELIVESAVVGGRTREEGKARWRRRLDGLAADFAFRIKELATEEPESPRLGRFQRDVRNLAHLRRFALPLVDELAGWPDEAVWNDWLDRLAVLAPRALKRPARVLDVIADLRPMGDVWPVFLDEVRDVLHDRLVALEWDPPARRYGRLFVGTPHQARGRTFRIVFVPGLAERLVPQRPREDPLLLDDRRRAVDPELACQDQRSVAERLLLKIAIGAATERVYFSYPRIDIAESRPRVPSFYALAVVRAISGHVPDHRALASEAAEEAGASLAWPAPKNPRRAIDDLEHDLATLKPLLDSRDPVRVKGHAHYMLGLNDALRRSVISRWSRGRTAWSPSDGLVRSSPPVAPVLAANRLGARPYSLSALQRFAACPYQFLLATIYRLEPWDEPEPLMRMDPLTRGSLFHKVQAEFYRAMQDARSLPIVPAQVPAATKTLDAVLDRVAAEYAEVLAPAIDRVWHDEIDELRRDLGIWLQKIADVPEWRPTYFEFSFGLDDEGRDPRSLPDPIRVDGRFVLRGSVDLIEEHAELGMLRITDHKTGKNRSNPDLIVGGGSTLQPVLYSVAIEQGLGRRVAAGRLFYCTTAGGFTEHPVKIDDYSRGQGLEVLSIIDRAIGEGFLAPAPEQRAGSRPACTWCDFQAVCGPREAERIERKAADRLADLAALRSMR